MLLEKLIKAFKRENYKFSGELRNKLCLFLVCRKSERFSSIHKVYLYEQLKKALVKSIPLFLTLIASISIIFFIKPAAVAGYTVPIGEFAYADSISLLINKSSEYSWDLENKGLLKSVKLNGEVKDSGTVKIYLEHENKTYLIFDNKKLEEFEVIEVPEESSKNISNQTKIN